VDVAVVLVMVKVAVAQAFVKLVVVVTVVLVVLEVVDEAVVVGPLVFPQKILPFPQLILPFPQVMFPHRFHLVVLSPHRFHLVAEAVTLAVAVAVAGAMRQSISHPRREISEPKPKADAGVQVLPALKLAMKLSLMRETECNFFVILLLRIQMTSQLKDTSWTSLGMETIELIIC